MKKALLLIGLCVSCLVNWQAQAANPESILLVNMENNLPQGYEEIELHGSIMLSVGPDTIDAGVGDNGVYIQFNQSVGNVTVSLYNGAGVLLYNNVVNTDVQQVVQIPMVILLGEEYLLELDNANGIAEGYFER